MRNNKYLLVQLNQKQIKLLIKWCRVHQFSNFTEKEKIEMAEIIKELKTIKFIK